MADRNQSRGFTLIEVMVSLIIIAVVVSGVIGRVNVWLDQRVAIQERFVAQTVAWNPLMERYMASKGWRRDTEPLKKEDVVEIGGREWTWEVDSEAAQGENFYRFETVVYEGRELSNTQLAGGGRRSSGSLVAFWIVLE